MSAFFVRKLLAWVIPILLQFAADWLAGAGQVCPFTSDHSTVLCSVWPQIVATVLGVLVYFNVHPNGAHGGPKPNLVSRTLSKVKVAPPVPPDTSWAPNVVPNTNASTSDAPRYTDGG